MRFSQLFALLAVVLATACAHLPPRPGGFDWQPLESLAGEDELRDARLKDLWIERGGPLWPYVSYARVPLRDGRDLLFFRVPETAVCGSYYAMFGPRNPNGSRTERYSDCSEAPRLDWRPNQTLPDIVTEISDLLVWRLAADGDGWVSLGMVVEIRKDSYWGQDSSSGPLSHLRRYVGTYDLPAVLLDPLVDRKLRTALKDRYVTLLKNLGRRGPIGFQWGCLFVSGIEPHEGGSEEAIMTVCADGTIHAAILTEEHTYLYSDERDFDTLPFEIRNFIARHRPIREAPKKDFTWIRN